MSIVIVGLGPGDGRYLTREAWNVLSQTQHLYARTREHPAIADLPPQVIVESFDALYEQATDFESVYQKIVAILVELGQHTDVVYAVPGSPHVGEATVPAIEQKASELGISVRVIAGLSFVEPTLAALRLDGLDGLQIFDAVTLAQYNHPPVSADVPLLLGQVYSRFLASELKLALMALYAPEYEVKLVHSAGSEAQLVETLPLHDIDRSTHIRNLTTLYVPPRTTIGSLPHFADTIALLRSPDGCPWDREQTPQSLRDSLLEEVAEVLDALDRDDPAELCEELGDLLLHIVMQAQMASEAGDFTITDVIAGIDAKIKRRHPHVWGDLQIETVEELSQTWRAIKVQEKAESAGGAGSSLLDNIPGALPALARSQKIQKRVAKIGFDWPDIDGVWAKLEEEKDELRQAETQDARTAELGDLLFVTVNLAKWMGIDAEVALREANLRFMQRFRIMEEDMSEQGYQFSELNLDQLDGLWQIAKQKVG
jgi:tetrapyrrole methylase family protein/MazG family protein